MDDRHHRCAQGGAAGQTDERAVSASRLAERSVLDLLGLGKPADSATRGRAEAAGRQRGGEPLGCRRLRGADQDGRGDGRGAAAADQGARRDVRDDLRRAAQPGDRARALRRLADVADHLHLRPVAERRDTGVRRVRDDVLGLLGSSVARLIHGPEAHASSEDNPLERCDQGLVGSTGGGLEHTNAGHLDAVQAPGVRVPEASAAGGAGRLERLDAGAERVDGSGVGRSPSAEGRAGVAQAAEGRADLDERSTVPRKRVLGHGEAAGRLEGGGLERAGGRGLGSTLTEKENGQETEEGRLHVALLTAQSGTAFTLWWVAVPPGSRILRLPPFGPHENAGRYTRPSISCGPFLLSSFVLERADTSSHELNE